MIFCGFCTAKAVRAVAHPNGARMPLCRCCERAYRAGQVSPDSQVLHLADMLLVERDDGTYQEVCCDCGAVIKITTWDVYCQACEEST